MRMASANEVKLLLEADNSSLRENAQRGRIPEFQVRHFFFAGRPFCGFSGNSTPKPNFKVRESLESTILPMTLTMAGFSLECS